MSEVIWHVCNGCGVEWPFPFPKASPHRDWVCQCCAERRLATMVRDLRAVTTYAALPGMGHQPRVEGPWVKADDIRGIWGKHVG